MPAALSIVITCAGTGSRLGLGITKALMEINGKTVIARQMKALRSVEDIRIVIGYQSDDVIEEVLRHRKDVVFVYNHDYMNTNTGASFCLGAKDANEYVIQWDGDLLVHPDDIKMLLETDGEFIAYSDRMSDEAVMVRTDGDGNVLSFSRDGGDFEWTGPACIRKDRLRNANGYVFNLLEPCLPMKGIKIRACDIDTYEDYQRAQRFIGTWYR